MTDKLKILLACQTATNKGDRAIAEYVISLFRSMGHEVVLSTTRPELWNLEGSQNFKVVGMGYKSIYKNIKNPYLRRAVYIFGKLVYEKILFSSLISKRGKHLFCRLVSKDFINEVKQADLTIVTGGHHITSIREKNALFQFTYDIGLISLYSKRYALWSQTIGPLEFTSSKAKAFFGNVLKNAQRVYIRDENSLDCINSLYGHLDNITKTYDSVFGFGSLDFPTLEERDKTVGIAIFDGLKKAFNTYDTLAKILDYYAKDGYKIDFFRMEYNDYELNSINSIIEKMTYKAQIKIHPFLSSTKEHLDKVAKCKYFIGYKTHSVIMALTTATPLLAIAYHKKTNDFMADYGLEQYAISDEALTLDSALGCVEKLNKEASKIHEKQRAFSKEIAQIIQKDLLELIRYEREN